MKVLITGGAGFIGSHVVRCLLLHGYEVIVVDNLTTGRKENLPAGVDLIKMDILDSQFISLVEQHNIDSIVHLAAQTLVDYSLKNPINDAEQNIMAVGHSVYDNVYMDQSNFSVSVPTNEIRPNNIGADLVVKDFTQLADIIFVDVVNVNLCFGSKAGTWSINWWKHRISYAG